MVGLSEQAYHRQLRAYWLAGVANDGSTTFSDVGITHHHTVEQVIEAAVVNAPLRGIRLLDLLAASRHGVTTATARSWARKRLAEIRVLAADPVPPSTVGWLIDRRRPARLLAWCDVMYGASRRREPALWPGFPFTPAPKEEA